MPQPVLRTARLLLVPLAGRHLGLEIELDSDPEVLRYLGGRARSAAEVAESHARRMALTGRVDGLGFWMAFGSGGGTHGSAAPASEEDGEFVGLMMLPPAHGPDQPDDPAVSDLGYRLVRRYWRQGLASEASRALLRHAFATVGQDRVIAQTMSVNTASRAVLQAIGMRYVRTFASSDDPFPGTELGEVEYEMTRDMWLALRADTRRAREWLPSGLAFGCSRYRCQRMVDVPVGWEVSDHEGAVKRASPEGEQRRVVEKAGADFGSHGLRRPPGAVQAHAVQGGTATAAAAPRAQARSGS